MSVEGTVPNTDDVSGGQSSDDVLQDLVEEVRELKADARRRDERIDALEAKLDTEREKRRRAEDVAQAAIAHARQLHEQPTVEFRGEDSKIKNLWIGGLPVGTVADRASERAKDLNGVVFGTACPDDDDIESAKDDGALVDRAGDNTSVSNGASGLSTDVRAKMLPVHEMWLDIVHDRADRLGNNDSPRRGARLFGRMVRRAGDNDDDELRLLVDVTEQNYVLRSTDARTILEEDDDPENAASQTVKRAMQAVEQFSNSLVRFDDSEKVNKLVAPKKAFHAAMDDVQEAIGGVHGGDAAEDADDPVEQAGEAPPTDVNDQFDQLASAARTDGGETGGF